MPVSHFNISIRGIYRIDYFIPPDDGKSENLFCRGGKRGSFGCGGITDLGQEMTMSSSAGGERLRFLLMV